MSWPRNPLEIDPEEVTQSILDFIQSRFKQLNREVAIIGLSGGLDSSTSAMLATKSLGADRVRLFYLPELDSNPLHKEHALLIAEDLEVDLITISLKPALRALGIYSLLPIRYFPGMRLKARVVDFGRKRLLAEDEEQILQTRLSGSSNSWVRRANAYISAKHRLRSAILYKESELLNGLVIGSANRTEWMTGTFTQFGCDHNADIMPLLHLYRSQIEVVATHLRLPQVILAKAADPDVLPGLNDKGELLGSFEIADQILWGIENGLPESDLIAQFGQEKTTALTSLVKASAYYRDTPYSLL